MLDTQERLDENDLHDRPENVLTLSIEEAYKKGSVDLDYFCKLALPGVIEFSFPDYYVTIWQLLVSSVTAKDRELVLRIALGLPRGFAKTTFVKLIVVWFLVYDLASFVLIVCENSPLAEKFLGDVDDILGSPNMELVYGKWNINKATDKVDEKTAMYRKRSVILKAIGSQSGIRGINIKHRRPDFLVCDDMQSKENDNSDTERQALLEWAAGTLFKVVNPRGALIWYIGNMYSTECLLYKFKENPLWYSLITGCILADGTSLWPELHPVHSLMQSFKHDEALQLGRIWFAEMMNDPTSSKVSLLPGGIIPPSPFDDDSINEELRDAAYIIIDPAGFKRLSDDNIIAVCYVIDGIPTIVDGIGGQLNPEEVINHTIELALRHNIRCIFVESVAYQATLAFWMNRLMKERKLFHFIIVEITPRGKSKEGRIGAVIKEVLAKTVIIHAREIRQKMLWQALAYKIGKTNNRDDWLDALAYSNEIRNNQEYYEMILSFGSSGVVHTQEARVRSNNTSF